MRHVSNAGSAEALAKFGPLFNVILLPHPSLANVLQPRGVLPTVKAAMMLDTGAEKTVIEKVVAEGMGLKPIRYTPMVGVSQREEMCPVYLMTIRLGVADQNNRQAVMDFHSEVIGMNSPQTSQAHRGLLGRDFLQGLHVVYSGPKGWAEVTLSAASLAGRGRQPR